MSGMLLSCADWPIIKQVADLLGMIMNLIYILFDKIGIANIGLCIIVFTILVRLCMIPMSIKQQKSMKLSALVNPEVQAIQKKYRGKNDNASMMAMNAETKAVYEKYGTSPTGGCLPMLIQMPILLALYGVISAIPTHVGPIEDMYVAATNEIIESMDEYSDLNTINQMMVDAKIEGFEKNEDFDKIISVYYNPDKSLDVNKATLNELMMDVYARGNAGLDTSRDSWGDLELLKEDSLEIIAALKNVTAEQWEEARKSSEYTELGQTARDEIDAYESGKNFDNMSAEIVANYTAAEVQHEEVISVYGFGGIDLSRSPSQEMAVGIWWAILIPVLSAVFQWVSMHFSSKSNQNQMQDNPMASSMKVMNMIFPVMSAFFCYSFASGLGLYWVIGSVIQFIQQIVLNNHFSKLSVDDIIKDNIAKINKKRAKKGLPPQKITAAANTNVKNIKVNTNTNTNTSVSNADKKPNNSAGVTYKKGGIAAKANMVKEYNEKKNK